MQIDEENLSHVMDDEAGAGDEFAQIASSPGARATWARYHLIGDVLRDNSSTVARADFAASVAARIADEPTVLAPRRKPGSVLKPVAGFAIAASVATLAVIGIQRTTPPAGTDAPPAVVAAPAPAAPVASLAAVAPPEAAAVNAATPVTTAPTAQPGVLRSQRRLNGYLVKFNEQRSNVGVPGVNPYVRIVGFESR